VIEAYNPITTYFPSSLSDQWTSTVVTATVIIQFTTYNDTIVTNTATISTTMTLTDPADEMPTLTAPTFEVAPAPGTYLTLEAGPTYVIYNNLFGGLDRYTSEYFAFITTTYETCEVIPTSLKNWEPSRTEDWSYLITSYTDERPVDTRTNIPVSLPTGVLQYLQQNLAILSQYNGHDIMTCTTQPTEGGIGVPTATNPDTHRPEIPEPTAPPYITTQTYISTSYDMTSSHTRVVGCLRAGCGVKPTSDPVFSEKAQDGPTPKESNILQPTNVGTVQRPSDKPNNPDGGNGQSRPSDKPNNPDGGNGQNRPTDQPNNPDDGNDNGQPNDQGPPGNPVTIGDSTYIIRPGQPTQKPDRPSEQDQPPAVVIVGSETLTPGQSTIINNVPVVVPSDRGGTRIIVGGTTIPVNNGPTAAPVLTVGRNPVTADPQGQFVVGTLSIGSGGTIAIINGVTQTLANVPIMTSPPVLTAGDRIVSATVVGGTTQLVLGSQTLAPGAALTIDGTTYSLPSSGSGSVVVVNGATSTLTPGQVLAQQSATAHIQDGTTAYIFGPSQTLTPGGVITVSGTTFSMPVSASGSVVVINGVTSTLANYNNNNNLVTAAPALTINGNTYTASIRDGTTEFAIASGTTLRPGEVLTLSGTTYSLDEQGTALVVNGQTSTIARGPASNSARTTRASSTSATARGVGDFVWSGIGGGGGSSGAGDASRGGGSSRFTKGGADKWVESLIMGLAGWVVMLV
jgi:hypothetical protein